MNRIKIGIIFFLLWSNFVVAINFGNITTEEGLSSDETMCITKDNNGFLWIGTKVGLNRYDGYESRVYDQKDGLSDAYINTIYADKSDNLWIGTGIGLSKLNLKTGEIKNYSKEDGFLENQMVMDIIKDDNGTLWIVSLKNGLMRYNQNEKFEQIKPITENATSLTKDSDGNLWVGTYTGLFKVDSSGMIKEYNTPKLLNSWVQDVSMGKNGDYIWLTAKKEGISKYYYKSDKIENFKLDNNNEGTKDISSLIRSVAEDKEGNVWVGTASEGLFLLEKGSDVFKRYYYKEDLRNSIPGNAIVDIHIGDKGLVWFATNGNGLARYDKSKNKFILYKNDKKNSNSISKGKVTGVYENRDGDLWVSLYDNGICKLESGSTKFKHYTKGSGNKIDISENRVFAIKEVEEYNELWVGTVGGALDIINLKTGEKKNFKDGKKGFKAKNNTAFRIYEDRDGIMWVTTYYSGVNKYNRETNSFVNYQNDPENKNSLSHNTVDSIFQDSNGDMWFGTDSGLNKFNPETEEFTRYFNDKNNLNTIGSDIIIALNEDSNKNLWIGTYNAGLNKMDLETGKITRYGKDYGLPNLTVGTILFDKKENVWFATKNGLCRLNPQNNNLLTFTKEDGLQGNSFYFNTHFKNSKGHMYFGGTKGLNKFDPQEIKVIDYEPKLILTEFSTIDRDIKGIEFKNKIELSYKENSFKMGFAALNYSGAQKQRYRYRLAHEEKRWMNLGREHYLTFSQMKSGNYDLEIQTTKSNGEWGENKLDFNILIKPPFWNTWWAYLIYLSILVGAILIWRKIDHDKKEKEYLRREQKLTEDLVKKKQEFTAKLIHDIRSPIGGMMGTIELLEAKDKEGKYKKYIKMLDSSGELLMSIVNNLLDLQKLKSNKMELNLSTMDIHESMEEIMDMFEFEAEKKGLNLYFEDNTDLDREIIGDKFRIEQVIINLLKNAMKFTYKGSVGIILNQKSLNKNSVELEFRVKDTGVGISEENKKKLFQKFTQFNKNSQNLYIGSGLGLNIVQELVNLMDGKIKLKSEVDKGTEFIINLEFDLK